MEVNNEHAAEWLEAYFTALKLWEEDENKTFALVNLFEEIQKDNDASSLAIKESLTNILSF